MEGAFFTEADLTPAIFATDSPGNLAPVHRPALFCGSDLTRSHFTAKWVSGDFSGACLRDASFIKSRCERVSFREAVLAGADFWEANLTYADLRGADLRGTNLRAANLSFAQMDEADLRGANLAQATLVKTSLRGARLGTKLAFTAPLCGTRI